MSSIKEAKMYLVDVVGRRLRARRRRVRRRELYVWNPHGNRDVLRVLRTEHERGRGRELGEEQLDRQGMKKTRRSPKMSDWKPGRGAPSF